MIKIFLLIKSTLIVLFVFFILTLSKINYKIKIVVNKVKKKVLILMSLITLIIGVKGLNVSASTEAKEVAMN